MFTYQAPCLRSQFENRKRRGIIDIQRSVIQFLNLIVQLPPFVWSQLPTLNFLARYFAHIDNQTIDQLHVRHFKREQCYRNFALTAIFLAIESTNAVLPMAGRAAIITRSEFCQPEVILSSAWKPLSKPLKPSVRAAAF